MVKPTPTQEENDLAATGQHVMNKEPDGSEEQQILQPVAKPAEPTRHESRHAEHTTTHRATARRTESVERS